MASKSTQRESILRGVTQKDMKQALRKLFKRGWEAEVSGSTHVHLVHPETGASIHLPLTSGSRGAGKRLMMESRKAISKAKTERRA